MKKMIKNEKKKKKKRRKKKEEEEKNKQTPQTNKQTKNSNRSGVDSYCDTYAPKQILIASKLNRNLKNEPLKHLSYVISECGSSFRHVSSSCDLVVTTYSLAFTKSQPETSVHPPSNEPRIELRIKKLNSEV